MQGCGDGDGCGPKRDGRHSAVSGAHLTRNPARHRGRVGSRCFVVAIDGPAASGKGTLARRLAEHFGLAHLDTGKLYRATALLVLGERGDPADPAAAERATQHLGATLLSDPRLGGEAVGAAASVVAAIPAVRQALLAFQRDFAAHPPAPALGAVLDGRDVGSVVCPTAAVKLFVTAAAESAPAVGSKSCGKRADRLYTKMSCGI
jgi:cytidylate kinase